MVVIAAYGAYTPPFRPPFRLSRDGVASSIIGAVVAWRPQSSSPPPARRDHGHPATG